MKSKDALEKDLKRLKKRLKELDDKKSTTLTYDEIINWADEEKRLKISIDKIENELKKQI